MKTFTINGKVARGIVLQQEIYGEKEPTAVTSLNLLRDDRNQVVKMVPIKKNVDAGDGSPVEREIGQQAVVFSTGVVLFDDGQIRLQKEVPDAEKDDRVLVKFEATSGPHGCVDILASNNVVKVHQSSNFPGDRRHHTEKAVLVAVMSPGDELSAYREGWHVKINLITVKYQGDNEFEVKEEHMQERPDREVVRHGVYL
ncbi:hypothetical protein ACFL2U_02320 [Patescibacteria group bacterium]